MDDTLKFLEQSEKILIYGIKANKNIMKGNAPKVKLNATASDLSKISSSLIFFIKILKI